MRYEMRWGHNGAAGVVVGFKDPRCPTAGTGPQGCPTSDPRPQGCPTLGCRHPPKAAWRPPALGREDEMRYEI